jgi:hypothetical protein
MINNLRKNRYFDKFANFEIHLKINNPLKCQRVKTDFFQSNNHAFATFQLIVAYLTVILVDFWLLKKVIIVGCLLINRSSKWLLVT